VGLIEEVDSSCELIFRVTDLMHKVDHYPNDEMGEHLSAIVLVRANQEPYNISPLEEDLT